jgi:peptidoglycan/LPS O-acetylase OafA/YrhL
MTDIATHPATATTRGVRILSLDGLRCLSILMVMAFHYFSRWTPPENPVNLYPYADRFAHWPFAQWGLLGVHLFFVISGYVIALTLVRCRSFGEFGVRRLARLWPTMFLCSVLTFSVVTLLPGPFDVSVRNFLPSWLFADPTIFNKLTGERTFAYMDGVYWSLFVEVRFYLLVALLYFADRARFARNLVIAGGLVAGAYALSLYLRHDAAETLLRWIFIGRDLPWFLIGAGLYFLDLDRWQARGLIAIGVLAVICNSATGNDPGMAIAAVALPAIAWCALRVRLAGRIFAWRPVAAIGAASYSLYLLHQYIGVTLIGHLAGSAPRSDVVALGSIAIVAAAITGLALLIYRYWETPLNSWLVRVHARWMSRRSPSMLGAGRPDAARQ